MKTNSIYKKLRTILTGKESVKLYLEFLKHNSQTDLLILKNYIWEIDLFCEHIVLPHWSDAGNKLVIGVFGERSRVFLLIN